MDKRSILLMALVCLIKSALGNIVPSNGAELNYTQVMFEFDQVSGADNYELTIMPQSSHQSNTVDSAITFKSHSLAILVKTGLAFGHTYQWHYKGFKGTSLVYHSSDLSFSIRRSPFVDSSLFRSKVTIHDKAASGEELVFLDDIGVLIDRNGRPVWFMPTGEEAGAKPPHYRCMRMTPTGTITYLKDSICSEVDLQGKLIWVSPDDGQISGERSEWYHHDFAKLKDGSYMTCGYRYRFETNPYQPSERSHVRYNTLIQYNAEGKVIWSWDEAGKFSTGSIFNDGRPRTAEVAGTHLNSFYYDAPNDALLLSFRNISRIAKIVRKTGQIIYQFGGKSDTFQLPNTSDADFSKQHAAVIDSNGDILFYNNNTDAGAFGKTPTYAHVTILKQPKATGSKATTVWDYECRSDSFPRGITGKEGFVSELANKHIFVCVGTGNRSFEVTREKKIVWECFHQYRDEATNAWKPYSNYRNNLTTSLFPYYFTITAASDTGSIHVGKVFKELTINNDGTEADTYQITAMSSNSVVLVKTTATVRSGSSFTPQLIFNKSSSLKGIINVVVYPVGNPTNKRSFPYIVK